MPIHGAETRCTTDELREFLSCRFYRPAIRGATPRSLARHPNVPLEWVVALLFPSTGNADLIFIHKTFARNSHLPEHILETIHSLYNGTNEMAEDLVRNTTTPIHILNDFALLVHPALYDVTSLARVIDWPLISAFANNPNLDKMDPASGQYLVWDVSRLLGDTDPEHVAIAMELLIAVYNNPKIRDWVDAETTTRVSAYVVANKHSLI